MTPVDQLDIEKNMPLDEACDILVAISPNNPEISDKNSSTEHTAMKDEEQEIPANPVTPASEDSSPKEVINPDQKLQELIDKMESALAQAGAPNFKLFWELRKACLEMFKENITPSFRTQSWARYREISKEAKKLKDLLDEQSAYAVEQIEIAIKALEEDLDQMPLHLEKMQEVDFEGIPKSFEKKMPYYSLLQKKLNLLNAHAARVNTLRKELIKTEMRIKHKNNFFERLSKAGDSIFPSRKEMIKEVSDHFEKDITAFVETYFGDHKEFVPTYFLRDDIKHLQNLAKILTLNSQSFAASRKKLSECWDALKKMDKDRKKEIQTKRDGIKKSVEEFAAKIEALDLSFNEGQISPSECLDNIEPLFKELRVLELGKDDSRLVKDKLAFLKKKAQDKVKEKQEERERLEREKRYKKQEVFLELQRKMQELMTQKSHTIDELKSIAANIHEEAQEFIGVYGKESEDTQKKLKALNEYIRDQEEEALIQNSTGNGPDSLKALREILQQKKKRRSEIKEEIEKLRKSSGNSGFDIEKALSQNEQVTVEKERLEKADAAISEIEDKIAEIKADLRKNA